MTSSPTLPLGALAGTVSAALTGILALRTKGVSFMIVTLMFAQAGYLTVIYFNQTTGGDQGLVLQGGARRLIGLDMAQDGPRLSVAFAGFMPPGWRGRWPSCAAGSAG